MPFIASNLDIFKIRFLCCMKYQHCEILSRKRDFLLRNMIRDNEKALKIFERLMESLNLVFQMAKNYNIEI